MQCGKCANSYRSEHDGMLECDIWSCQDDSEFVPISIPVNWIREQIKSNPEYAESWRKLIDSWNDALLKARFSQQPVKNDEYVRLHEDQTAAEKFWRNE